MYSNRTSWIVILALIIVGFGVSTCAHAEVYVPISINAVYFQKYEGDNNWYQDRWPSNKRWTGYGASLGLGKDFGQWSGEINLRYLNGGRLDAVLEYDTTYENDYSEHNPVEHTVTTWNVRGVSLDLICHFNGPYLRAGLFSFQGQTTNHVEFWDSGKVVDITREGSRIEPLFGFGILANKISLEYIYYPLINVAESPAKSAHTLNLGYKF